MTPEQEEQVRRALGAVARAEDGPETRGLPPDVAERLDDVLHELVTERAGRSARPTVPGPAAGADELAARRHRRWPTVLVAAAAVAVIAAAGGAVATRGFGGGAESSSAGSSSDLVASGSPGTAAPSGAAAGSVLPLSSRTLARDIRNVAATGLRSFMAPRDRGRDLATLPRPDHVRCGRPDTPRGADVVAVYLDGLPGTLVLTPATGGPRVARVYSCAVPPALVSTLSVRVSR
ncbi:MAG TPA: hypothetical protein VFP51_12425 [Nocardioidaceae bacterium]|nr:hypothetical protein [Nocardioidaceae bacterium]